MADLYMRLGYEEYKALEDQLYRYRALETVHESTGGYYHKSFRLKIGDLTLEFHGPIVKAAQEELAEGRFGSRVEAAAEA